MHALVYVKKDTTLSIYLILGIQVVFLISWAPTPDSIYTCVIAY